MMRTLGSSGVWEIFVPEVGEGTKYKFEIRTRDGDLLLKIGSLRDSDGDAAGDRIGGMPAALRVSRPRVDGGARAIATSCKTPVSIYEVHLGSWRRKPDEDHRSLNYRELAQRARRLRR